LYDIFRTLKISTTFYGATLSRSSRRHRALKSKDLVYSRSFVFFGEGPPYRRSSGCMILFLTSKYRQPLAKRVPSHFSPDLTCLPAGRFRTRKISLSSFFLRKLFRLYDNFEKLSTTFYEGTPVPSHSEMYASIHFARSYRKPSFPSPIKLSPRKFYPLLGGETIRGIVARLTEIVYE
jgi:hypothetical protein